MAFLKKQPKGNTDTNEMDESKESYPTSMNDYQFEGRIGKGAFGSVYVAKCLPLNKLVAIKVIELETIDSNQANDDQAKKNENEEDNNNNNEIQLEEIKKESQVMKRMKHPNIVRCYATFSIQRELWLVCDLQIGSCSDIMKTVKEFNKGFVDEFIVCTIIRDVLCGIEYIAKDGRIHRDIKSANILLSANGVCQISDFGVSGAIIEGGLRKAGRQTFTGSLWWMSPEILQRENRHSYKADIWSIGITALELAFGKPPHFNQRPVKVMLTILQSPPPTIDFCNIENETNYKYSKKFVQFLAKCLQKDPNKRPSATALLNHSFIKQAKDRQYLCDHILSKHVSSKSYKNEILPYSKEKQKKLANKDKNENKSNVVESGFDFNSEINSISHSLSTSDKNTNEIMNDATSIGRFDVSVQDIKNEQNDNDNSTKKGRFDIKKLN